MCESEVSCRITATRCRALTNTFAFVPLCTGIATQLLSNRVTVRARYPSVALDSMPRAVVGATVRYRLVSLSNLSNPKQQTLRTHTRNLVDISKNGPISCTPCLLGDLAFRSIKAPARLGTVQSGLISLLVAVQKN